MALPDHLAGAGLRGVAPHLPLPPKLLREMSANNMITVQGKQLRLRLFPREPHGIPADWMDLNILYEDDFSLVVNKPAGVEIHPSVKGQRGTLANAVAAYYETTGQAVKVRPMHRLDKDTTGPVLFAKNEFAQAVFERALRDKEVDREYIAIAEGVMQKNKDKIDLPIGQDRGHSTRRRVSETGESALTYYNVDERFRDHTLVRLTLGTGRTHQIRVHLSAIGHPIAGDGMYGGGRRYIQRQALHGEKLSWAHPWTGDKQSVRAPLPDDMIWAINELRKGR
ncbi:RluA family pseudouridine synthase [Paenibacillus chartarius]|uniref:Pseudouridine synthase n=1 Tax=Paenibacillus chartarius TaxID=747481 RepID=A0ABV6DNQ6_9BACL